MVGLISRPESFYWLGDVFRAFKKGWRYFYSRTPLKWYGDKIGTEIVERWICPILSYFTESRDTLKNIPYFTKDHYDYLNGGMIPQEKVLQVCSDFFISFELLIILPLIVSCFLLSLHPKTRSFFTMNAFQKICQTILFYLLIILPFKSSIAIRSVREFALNILSLFFSFEYILCIDEMIFVFFVVVAFSAFNICKAAGPNYNACRRFMDLELFMTILLKKVAFLAFHAFIINRVISIGGDDIVINIAALVSFVTLLLACYNFKKLRSIFMDCLENLVIDFIAIVILLGVILNSLMAIMAIIASLDFITHPLNDFMVGFLLFLTRSNPGLLIFIIVIMRVLKTFISAKKGRQKSKNAAKIPNLANDTPGEEVTSDYSPKNGNPPVEVEEQQAEKAASGDEFSISSQN